MPTRDRLHRHETDIVAVADIARAGIAEADEKQHGVGGAVPACRITENANEKACAPPHFLSGFAGAAAGGRRSTGRRGAAPA